MFFTRLKQTKNRRNHKKTEDLKMSFLVVYCPHCLNHETKEIQEDAPEEDCLGQEKLKEFKDKQKNGAPAICYECITVLKIKLTTYAPSIPSLISLSCNSSESTKSISQKTSFKKSSNGNVLDKLGYCATATE